MPFSTSLPAPNIEWQYRIFYPAMQQNPINTNIGTLTFIFQRPMPWPGGDGAGANTSGIFAAGTAGVVQQFRLFKGRPCAQWIPPGPGDGPSGQGGVPQDWAPAMDPAGLAVGSKSNPSSLVAVYDFHCCVSTAALLAGDDRCGFFFLPQGNGTTSVGQSQPFAAIGTGGFGVFFNDDGAGVNRLEYVAWSGNPGADLERIPIGVGIVPDITDWSTVRFIIVGATPGRAPFLTVQCNGFDVLVGREFGSAFLQTPAAMDTAGLSNRLGWVANVQSNAGNLPMNWAMSAKFGRFTPDGAEQGAL